MNIQLKDFEGPFDLLLHLVRIAKVDIYEINISDIINQYLEFIDKVKDDLDSSSEYLVMAAELVHLKSKMLVNKEEEKEDDEESEYSINSEEDLKRKIKQYEQYKDLSMVLADLEKNRADYYTKLPENLKDYVEDEHVINSNVAIDELLQAFLDMQKRINLTKPEVTKVTRKEYSVKERMQEIRNILKIRKRVEFTELFDIITKENLVVTFLSILDMSKRAEIMLKQEKNFGSIIIESLEKSDF